MVLNRRAASRHANTVKFTPRTSSDGESISSKPNTLRTSHTQVEAQEYHLHTPSKTRNNRQPKGASRAKHLINHRPQVILTNGRQYLQKPNLPYTNDPQINIPESAGAFDFFRLDQLDPLPEDSAGGSVPPTSSMSRHRKKKMNQWNTWATKVIPSLVGPLLKLYSITKSLRYPPSVADELLCHCGQGTQRLTVMCIYWQHIRNIKVTVCSCSSPSILLLEHALFPCAPTQPSLAVDINMLEFLCDLNNRQAPNNSAWCQTLLHIYRARIDNVPSFDSLRKRFANALLWYSVLINSTHKYMDNIMTNSSNITSDTLDEYPTSSFSDPTSPLNNSAALGSSIADVPSSTDSNLTAEHNLGNTLGRKASDNTPIECYASSYLRNRCPCCFSLEFERPPQDVDSDGDINDIKVPLIPDVIVQIDANFGQKRRHGANDPILYHPYTKFLSEEELAYMENHLDQIRGGATRRQPRRSTVVGSEDQLEATGLPSSVLDACEATFEAADSRRHKASTKFFSNTGTMAILCRHEHVLFMANMTSAGEKQFYAFALLKAVISNLPTHTTVGVLYDIGCQIHRSVMKWNLFPELQHRLTFGISVFHAYGHEWPCQLLYNPRKCVGFGLSDGEGCERLWSSLKELIPNLRVTGHHRRLYILDDRIEFDKNSRLWRTGLWLRKAYTEAENRFSCAKAILDIIPLSDTELRNEWRLQLITQTKPLPSQSKNKAQNIIKSTLRIWEQMTACQEEIHAFEARADQTPAHGPSDEISPDEADIMLEDLQSKLERLRHSYNNKMKALGVTERRQLEGLKSDKYLNLRMNLRAKKQRIRERVRRRKFELSRLAKSSSHSITERKLVDHSEKMITQREPTILRLVSDYNKGCDSLKNMIDRRQVPRGVHIQVPQKIDSTRIFSAEMDETLWQDVGLEDDSVSVPRWLGDDDVRKGILALLSMDRSIEELDRVEKEVRSAQRWIYETILNISRCLDQFGSVGDCNDLVYAFTKRLLDYKALYTYWMDDLCHIPGFQQDFHVSILEIFEMLGENTHDERRQSLGETRSETDTESSLFSDRSFQENCQVIDALEMLELREDRLDSFTADVEPFNTEDVSSTPARNEVNSNPFVNRESIMTPVGLFSHSRPSVRWVTEDEWASPSSPTSLGMLVSKKRKLEHIYEKQ